MHPRNHHSPIGIPCHWQHPDQLVINDPCLKNWLLDTSSLTERLQSHCRDFNLQVLFHQPCQPQPEECAVLDAHPPGWQVREVLLKSAKQPWVFAHSVIPTSQLLDEITTLGNKPLGKLLFNDPRFTRQPFELCCIKNSQPLLHTLGIEGHMTLWGRRSIFRFQGLSMLVAEVFLPDSPAYKMMVNP